MELKRVAEMVHSSFEQLYFVLMNLDLSELPRLPRESISQLPANMSAVYFFFKPATIEILYIGATQDLRRRFLAKRGHEHLARRPNAPIEVAWWSWPLAYVPILELFLIQLHQPPWNRHSKWADRAIIPENFGLFTKT